MSTSSRLPMQANAAGNPPAAAHGIAMQRMPGGLSVIAGEALGPDAAQAGLELGSGAR
jgi:hypothetical protein